MIFFIPTFQFRRFLLTLFTSLILLQSHAFAQVKASLSQQAYYQGDLITLLIETNDNQKIDPDISVLQQNFNIKGSSTSSQTNIINGNRSYKKVWKIELQAKTIGDLTIPEITVGNEKTKVLNISINKLPPEISAETSKHVFIEATVDIPNGEIYVQQQIPYTLKFFYDTAMQTGEVILPTIENANIRIVGLEKKHQVERRGNMYVMIERRYVISPEKSGELVIPPAIVQGRMALASDSAPQLRNKRTNEIDRLNELFSSLNSGSIFTNPFDPFSSRRSLGPTRPFTASSESIQINVLPVPESVTGSAWLPTEEIKMQDSWTTNPPTLKVGEPVTRTIIMQVKGLASSQIPEIKIPKPEGIKVYPEHAKSETPNDGSTIYGIQRVEITYIPNRVGAVIIPEINVDWWDVNNKKQQTYNLPEWNLKVATGVMKTNKTMAEPVAMNDSNPDAELSLATDLMTPSRYWGWKFLLGVLALTSISLLFLAYCINKRLQSSPKHSVQNKRRKKQMDARVLLTSLLNACNANSNTSASVLLIKHAQITLRDSKIQNLGVLAKKLNHGSDVIRELEASLYSGHIDSWKGNPLHQLVSQGLQAKEDKKIQQQVNLAPLYPD